MPAAASRWPTFVFTDPTTSGRSAAGRCAEHAAERLHLDRIAERGAGAVRLDVVDVGGLDAARARAPRGSPLPAPGRSARSGRCSAVLIDGAPADDARGSDRRRRRASESRLSTTTPQPSPRTKPSAAASNVLQRPSAASIRDFENAMLLSGVRIRLTPPASAIRQSPAAQALAGEVHRDQRRRARGVDRDAGPCRPRMYESRPDATLWATPEAKCASMRVDVAAP